MINRLDVLNALSHATELSMAKNRQALALVDKAIVFYLQNLSLSDARALRQRDRKLIEDTLDQVLVMADLKKVSKLWEPKRRIGAAESHTELVDMLISLLRGEREPYTPVTLSLPAARALTGPEREAVSQTILHFAPDADLPKLLKKWDKHLPDGARLHIDAVAAHLSDLVMGNADPSPPPPKARQAKG